MVRISPLRVVMAAAVLWAAAATHAQGAILGASKPVEASCPDDCVVEAKVTAFQTSIDRRRKPFVVGRTGRITEWSIKLGDPGKTDRRFFNETFGGSQARLSILKPVKAANGKRKLRLVRQSPTALLAPHFGSIATFALEKPLRVRPRQIVALTIPTWAPAFAAAPSVSSGWRAGRVSSKARGACTIDGGLANVDAGGPHMKMRTQRSYGCAYRSSRLLYSARLVADRRRGG